MRKLTPAGKFWIAYFVLLVVALMGASAAWGKSPAKLKVTVYSVVEHVVCGELYGYSVTFSDGTLYLVGKHDNVPEETMTALIQAADKKNSYGRLDIKDPKFCGRMI